MKQIYRKSKERNLSFRHVCEVGVYLPETSNIIDFIKEGIRATLVEADPETVEKIRSYFDGYNITLHHCAVWDHNGTIRLSKAKASTFVSELKSSPAIENDQYEIRASETFEVPCKRFTEIDTSDIDLLSIDIEGSEWFVIKYLISKPKLISVETHGKYYTNPYIHEIEEWMEKNDYIIWYKDGSDTVFVQSGLFTPSASDRLYTKYNELKIKWKKLKKLFK